MVLKPEEISTVVSKKYEVEIKGLESRIDRELIKNGDFAQVVVNGIPEPVQEYLRDKYVKAGWKVKFSSSQKEGQHYMSVDNFPVREYDE